MELKSDTLVIELLTETRVGEGEAGSAMLKQFLLEQAEIIAFRERLLAPPQTHLSEKYGYAAWIHGLLPSGDPCTIHVYVWDDRSPSFISIDILIPAKRLGQCGGRLREHIESFFNSLNILLFCRSHIASLNPPQTT